MAKPYSQDLRDRVLGAIEKDGMSRRGAAERFEIGGVLGHQMDGASGAHRFSDGCADGRLQTPETGPSSRVSRSRAGGEARHFAGAL
jgi:transposase